MQEELFDPSCSACERAQEDFAKQEQRIAELERVNEELEREAKQVVDIELAAIEARCMALIDPLKQKLAAAQATIAAKDEALRIIAGDDVTGHHENCLCRYCVATEALALPSDSTALDAMLVEAEKRGMLKAAEWLRGQGQPGYADDIECRAIRQASERGGK